MLPALVEHQERREWKALAALVSRLLMLVTIGLTLLTVAFVFIAPLLLPAILGSGFSDSTTDLAVSLSQLFFPIVILLGAQSISVAVLNSENRFTLPAYAPVVWNLVVIVGLVALHPADLGEDSIYAYAIAVLAGSVAQLLWLAPGLTMFRLRAAWRRSTDQLQVRRLLIRIAPVALVGVALEGNFVINLIVGSLVGEQVPRSLQAAYRLSIVGGLASAAIMTVAYPTFRRQVLRGQRAELADLIGRTVRANLALLIAIAAFAVAAAIPLTSVMYERGEFGSESTELVSTALVWLAVGLPAFGVWQLLTRVCFAADRYWQPAAFAVASLVIDLALSLWLQGPFGIAGIAVASSASLTAVTVGLAAYIRVSVVAYAVSPLLRSAVALTVIGALMAATAAGCIAAVQSAAGEGFVADLLALAAAAGVGGAVYVATMRVASPADAALMAEQLRRAIPWRGARS